MLFDKTLETTMPTNFAVSVDTAATLMDISKRTLWRHLADGQYSPQPKDPQGRTVLLLSEVAPKFSIELLPGDGNPDTDDYALLALADQGDANCQADFAVLLLEQEKPGLAAHWFALAAEKEHPDAMHHLSVLYQTGQGVKRSEETAMVWRSRAAAAGHKIARAQLDDMKVWG